MWHIKVRPTNLDTGGLEGLIEVSRKPKGHLEKGKTGSLDTLGMLCGHEGNRVGTKYN